MISNLRSFRRVGCAVVVLLGAVCAGCDAVGALIYKTQGPTKIEAQYVLPKDPTLILVENRRNPAAGEYDADEIARSVSEGLNVHMAAPLVDLDRLTRLRDADPDKYRQMPITAVGRACMAKQVIYVNLLESGIESDASESSIHGKATARVRVINSENGRTLWPLDSNTEGKEVEVEIPYSSHNDPVTISAMHSAMISQLSDSIGKLFYAWRPEDEHEGDVASQ